MHEMYGLKSTGSGISEEGGSETLVFKNFVLPDVENIFKENLWLLIHIVFVNICLRKHKQSKMNVRNIQVGAFNDKDMDS